MAISIWDNQSFASAVGAFLGASFSFVLVWYTDRRRANKAIEGINNEISLNLKLAHRKSESVKQTLEIALGGSVQNGPVMHFELSVIDSLLPDAKGRIEGDQREALSAIGFTMRAVDTLIDQAWAAIEMVKRPGCEQDEATHRLLHFQSELRDILAALDRTVWMCEQYIYADFRNILHARYPATNAASAPIIPPR